MTEPNAQELAAIRAKLTEINNKIFDEVENTLPEGNYIRELLYSVRCKIGQIQNACYERGAK